MNVVPLQDKQRIEAFFRRKPELYIYAIGDLDDFFWPYTTWYGREEVGELRDIALVYTAKALPTVIALTEEPEGMRTLLTEIARLLPQRFHAHLSLGLEELFRNDYLIEPHGVFQKMALHDPSPVRQIDGARALQLTEADLPEMLAFYAQSYPGNWFDERMVATGRYFGLRENGQLICIAGVHVYSTRYRVAALGNIVTHPAHRDQGYATRVTARLCQVLLDEVDHIGLNVKVDNKAAIACYGKLGFEVVAPYGEFNITRRV
ncbi:MAG: GNAT family N-acetyltransferase [Phycisphaerales bacterium]|nr:MAG: GNAT family N-acetyltransferase [Phycisphaerales bacterium]